VRGVFGVQNLVGTLISVQAGKPRKMEFEGKAWRSAIYKATLPGRVAVNLTNIEGDKQANLKYHGGPDKAICCFPAEHFEFWRTQLGRGEEFGFGAFGENFTLQDLTEDQVCIGDTFTVGTAVVQVPGVSRFLQANLLNIITQIWLQTGTFDIRCPVFLWLPLQRYLNCDFSLPVSVASSSRCGEDRPFHAPIRSLATIQWG
jgi:hypothetical protein